MFKGYSEHSEHVKSRLERLVLLLDTGTPVVRNTAADQLAQVQKAQPDELYNLLGRVAPYLKSPQWDTRVAAARAIGGIVELVPLLDSGSATNGLSGVQAKDVSADAMVVKSEEGDAEDLKPATTTTTNSDGLPADQVDGGSKAQQGPEVDRARLTFTNFDIMTVIANGRPLLGSAGKEYDWSGLDMSTEERLARAKHDVTTRLGLGAEFMDKDFLSAHDLTASAATRLSPASTPLRSVQPIKIPPSNRSSMQQADVSSPRTPETPNTEEGLSARQRNMMKRKAKLDGKGHTNKMRVIDVSGSAAIRRQSHDENSLMTPAQEQANGDYFSVTPQAQNESKIVVEHKIAPQTPSTAIRNGIAEGGWPLAGLVELLIIDIFDLRWETRHGAALALREVLRSQAPAAGKHAQWDHSTNTAANASYLDDIACRLCCIFALDRFGDYVSDQVVAPVRETVAQTLAALLKHLPETSVKATFTILTALVFQDRQNDTIGDSKESAQQGSRYKKAWEVTHGGMLGMKYLVAIRQDVLLESPEMLDWIIAAVLYALEETDDDVRAVGAATLLPIAAEFVKARPSSISMLLDVLWECLAELRDDLSASTGSIMDLLAKLCSIPAVLLVMQDKANQDSAHSFANLVPRLYPFLRHTITSVRQAVLRALGIFLHVDNTHQSWVDSRLLRLLMQVLLLEQTPQVLAAAADLWLASINGVHSRNPDKLKDLFSPYLQALIAVTMTPIGHGRQSIALDVHAFIRPSGQPYNLGNITGKGMHSPAGDGPKSNRKKRDAGRDDSEHSHNIDAPMIRAELELVGLDAILRTRVTAATALGQLLASWPEDIQTVELEKVLVAANTASASSPRYLAAVLIQESVIRLPDTAKLAALRETFENLLTRPLPDFYSNLTHLLHIVRSQCQALCTAFTEIARLPQSKIPVLPVVCRGEASAGPHAFDLEHAQSLVDEDFERMRRAAGPTLKGQALKSVQDARQSVLLAVAAMREAKYAEDVRISACNGAALVALKQLPKKLNPIIKSLMDSLKTEENEFMQRRSAQAVASLVDLCSASGRGSAADKLIKNLCAFLCVDTSETPEFHRHVKLTYGIYSLKKETDVHTMDDQEQHNKEVKDVKIKHLGAQMALVTMAQRFQGNLFSIIPKLSDCIFGPLVRAFSESAAPELTSSDSTLGQEIVDGLSILGALVNDLDSSLLHTVLEAMPAILRALHCQYATIRHIAAAAFAKICKASMIQGMQIAVTDVIPMLADAGHLEKRQGAIEAVQMLVNTMDIGILPYVIFLIVPVLGRMSDSDNDIRIVATTTFASLVKLVPLEAGIPDPVGLSEDLLAGRDQERKFIQQMLNGSKVDPFEIPVAIKADLRSYQQEGVNWLAFLNRYQLHGILCDDMGLGKTLQTICIVASDHHNRKLKYKETALAEHRPLASIIVCPPSLTGHWQHELETYAPFLRAVSYVGNPTERRAHKPVLGSADVIITSYDIARNDIEYLSKKSFNYCVLDEGHIIKNAKAKLTQAVKLIQANHRLILSGTPIQNNVLELWSLFDFLMPGFLGTEKSFHERYAKPIANSRDSKSSSKEQEAGALALEALHKQVLPFLLRRLKEEVLADLPPKIIQDYYCELSPLQKSLYTQFTTSQAATMVQEVSDDAKKEQKSHVFQALQYMRKLCNHPALVLNAKHPKYRSTMQDLAARGQEVRDIQHAPKLLALRDLLLDCGIGSTDPEVSGRDVAATLNASVVNQHRALIFCQIKDMLDMVEHDVLKKLLPSVSYMRLDGTTDPRKRQSIVQEFNADPSIDVLLLTTHVGGLGLNLTGADTVIFVEHDWNPMKDLQAMDRAHRIGQKKTVNVYRLITRGTLEEKIMGLQKFKLNIASTIVNQQNSGLATMATDQILDLFNVESTIDTKKKEEEENGVDSQGNLIKKGQKSVFDDLDALHNEDEYADFDVDAFVSTL